LKFSAEKKTGGGGDDKTSKGPEGPVLPKKESPPADVITDDLLVRISHWKYRWHTNPWFVKRGIIDLSWYHYIVPILIMSSAICLSIVLEFELGWFRYIEQVWYGVPILVYGVSIGILVLLILLWNRKYVFYEYEFYRFFSDAEHTNDERPDALSLGEMKHKRPLYAQIRFHTNDPKYGLEYKERYLTISLELLAQLLVPQNISMTSSPQMIHERLEYMAKSVHTVNTSRWRNVWGQAIYQDTILVAMGYALHTLENRRVEVQVFRMAPAI
jgi:hypothetical protein